MFRCVSMGIHEDLLLVFKYAYNLCWSASTLPWLINEGQTHYKFTLLTFDINLKDQER